jgi:hypothetical protein
LLLKTNVQRDLHHPRTQRSGGLSKVGVEDISIRIAEVRMIEDIERVQAQLSVQSILVEELKMLGESMSILISPGPRMALRPSVPSVNCPSSEAALAWAIEFSANNRAVETPPG